MLEVPNVGETEVAQTVWEGGRRTKRTGDADEMQEHGFGHRFCEIQTAQRTTHLAFHVHEQVVRVHLDSVHVGATEDFGPLIICGQVLANAWPNLTNTGWDFLSFRRLAHHDNHNHTLWLHEDLHDFIPPWQKRQ